MKLNPTTPLATQLVFLVPDGNAKPASLGKRVALIFKEIVTGLHDFIFSKGYTIQFLATTFTKSHEKFPSSASAAGAGSGTSG